MVVLTQKFKKCWEFRFPNNSSTCRSKRSQSFSPTKGSVPVLLLARSVGSPIREVCVTVQRVMQQRAIDRLMSSYWENVRGALLRAIYISVYTGHWSYPGEI